MREYNEFVRKTKDRLRLYKQFKATAENLQDEANLIQKELDNDPKLAPPAARYGTDAGGGTGELNGVEAAVERRMQLCRKIQQLEMEREECLLTIRQIDRALEGLSFSDADIIKEKYFDGKDWESIGEKRNYGGKWARERGAAIIKDMATMIFGKKAHPTRLRFVFDRS